MTNLRSAYLVLTLVLVTAMSAKAQLVLHITDEGSGNTLWTFSGSTNIAENLANSTVYSIANPDGAAWIGGSPLAAAFDLATATSGKGHFSVTSGLFDPVFSSDLVFAQGTLVNPEQSLDVPFDFTSFTPVLGDTLTWSDSAVFAIPYSDFNPGTYSTLRLSAGLSPSVLLTSPYTIVVGPYTVPEPSTYALVGLGVLGLVLGHRRLSARTMS